MSEFTLKMQQVLFRLGLRPRPHWGAYSTPPDPLTGFKEREGRKDGRAGHGRGRGEWREWKGRRKRRDRGREGGEEEW